jgi:HTH-type transcriptional regulator, cell division transcriptional repressor
VKKTTKANLKNCVGERVRQFRLCAKPVISQEDLAGRLAAKGISIDRSAISRIESGERYVLDYELKAIAVCLGVTSGTLLD